ncbi:DUF2093 domain-containing protein [Maricaulis alexandrii]|uniref:DUF2093 domain-containing protein n=1 Tax=Maricaulis alexandrii TaxID=2570354 RepID=UPI001109D026|nr:DUF2093 domain-containing protein [Maricaulis alexandrii]
MSDFTFDKEFQGEAILEYGDSDFIILKGGAYVTCAVTGDKIGLAELRYWNVDEQEAYRDALAAKQRWLDLNAGPGQ